MPFNNETINWNDLRLFLAVAQERQLASAALLTGSSTPTLSRRMRHLENALCMQLFDKTQTGFQLTNHGKELFDRVSEMDLQSKSIQTWLQHQDHRPLVRIAAGTWTSVFLAGQIGEFAPLPNSPRIELITGTGFLNLLCNEADIAIRNKIPEQQGMVRKRIGAVRFSIFGSHKFCTDNPAAFSEDRFEKCSWVIPSVIGGTGTSSFWIQQRIGDTARLICGTPHAVLEAVVNGAGLSVLPNFIGLKDQRLVRCSEPIECLTHTQWLATDEENGKLPHIRQTARKLAKLFSSNLKIFE